MFWDALWFCVRDVFFEIELCVQGHSPGGPMVRFHVSN